MPAASVMIQGTNSNAGKSVLVAGLCRAYARRGLSVQPFKPQNMSNNAAAVPGGGEIGRAQALQARAAGVPLSVHHNPVLLKPESDRGSQVVVQGSVVGKLDASRFTVDRDGLMIPVLESFDKIGNDADLVVVEGAGSPAETNLRHGDIANMGFASAARVPVIITGDIDRGGVIASLVGTNVVLSAEDRALIRGFVINKFRGDVGLFGPGITDIEARTGWPSLGVVTWCPALAALPAEDAVELEQPARRAGDRSAPLRIAVPMLSRIANFDDVDPLRLEPNVSVTMVPPGKPIGETDLIILPGSKATIADLAFLRDQGWDIDIAAHVRRGRPVLGLCGGYQLLGRTIEDPDGVEGPPQRVAGLGLLDVHTVLTGEKVTRPVTGRHVGSDTEIAGYEIHVGRTDGPDTKRPWLQLEDGPAGATSADGLVAGSYLHGIFSSDGFRAAYLSAVADGGRFGASSYEQAVDDALDEWADQLESELDLDRLLTIARTGPD
ncbi:MAG: cobyric acid synthase [Actinomycetota bacterium]